MDPSRWGPPSPNASVSPGGSTASTGADFLLELLRAQQLIGQNVSPVPPQRPRQAPDWMPNLGRGQETSTPPHYEVGPFLRGVSAMLQNPMPEVQSAVPVWGLGMPGNPFVPSDFGGWSGRGQGETTPRVRPKFPGDPTEQTTTPWDLLTGLAGTTPGR